MPISLALRGKHAHDAIGETAWQSALVSLRDADRVFSTYRADSEISRLGRNEIALDACAPVVREVLDLAEQARVESGGAFDVRRDGGLDPSGVVKGWVVQRASEALATLEKTDFCLSAGGDMVCRTSAPNSPGWRIAVEDPWDPTQTVAVLPIRNGAVATSGLIHRGAHITNPITGATPTYFASVTVIAGDLIDADIDATTAFVLGPHALSWLEGRPGRTGVLVQANGRASVFGAAA